jgi:hypothetical protein
MKMNKTCSHFIVGFVAGKDVVCRLDAIEHYLKYTAKIYYVGVGDPPQEFIEKCRKGWFKFTYCPKCGAKLETLK